MSPLRRPRRAQARRPARPLVPALLVALALAAGAAGSHVADAGSASPPLAPGLQADVAALIAQGRSQDSRLTALLPGYRPGELAYFVVAEGRVGQARLRELTGAGARVLRTYRVIEAAAVASTPSELRRVAELPWVRRVAPVELVFSASHEREVDQTRGTTGDLGAQALWDSGLTGSGITIAVLDTGLDPTHPDLDDLDFRHWSSVLNDGKVVDARSFVGGGCVPLAGSSDGHGHGTHVAGIAAGTGEGAPSPVDDGRYAGIAPGARLAVGKVLTDAGAGLNSDLLAAMEWAAMPPAPGRCAVGAQIVNLSLGSESRPTRLNTGSDVDLVSLTLNRLAVRYGTLFTVAAGNSGPFVGSVLEAPGSAAQALSVAASAKDYDVNHDDTLSGDTCAGYQHAPSTANDCSTGSGTQPPSLGSFSSRGPAGDLWLRPDVSAPGYNIVSAQAATGVALAQNDLNRGTRSDPLYATATGTSMAAPATAGGAALLLQGYNDRYESLPSGASGLEGLTAPAYTLVRAALMNTAGSGQYEARWILSTDLDTVLTCPLELDPILVDFCSIGAQIGGVLGNLVLYEARNRAADPYVGPLAEGAGKLNLGRALVALRDGVVMYSGASGAGADAGTGPRDLQGTWQIGATAAGASHKQRFVLHAAPGAPRVKVRFSFSPGNPSDGSRAIVAGKGGWSIGLPATVNVPPGGDAVVELTAKVPAGAAPGHYTGTVVATVSNGQVLQIPVFASVALHDSDARPDRVGGPQATVGSATDVFGKADTIWPSAAGSAGTGAGSDWLVFPVELGAGLHEARFAVYDAAVGDETYDLYLYGPGFELLATTHPFAAPGVTDVDANSARGPSTSSAPQRLTVSAPSAGRYYLVVSRAKVGLLPGSGDFGAFVLTLDESR